MIDYITSRTGQRRMHYVGHSQGTTAFFVMCSERPVYNDRIISAHMLAPVAFMGNLKSPFVRSAAAFLNTLDVILFDRVFFPLTPFLYCPFKRTTDGNEFPRNL